MALRKRSIPASPVLRAWLLLGLLLLATGCTGAPVDPAAPSSSPGISLQPCQLSAPGIAARLEAECGTLTVYEDRAAKTGRQIDLNVAVIPTISRSPAPDPLFFLTGGPGQAATQSYLQLSSAFNRIGEKRDIVLVDQRGTGDSHPLDCPSLRDAEEPSGDGDAQLAGALGSCLRQLDADPTLYTTSPAMDDLDQVREALGYEKINIYGVSYGTRAALAYLRQHPDRVRSVILDGVWPFGLPLGSNAAASAQRALDLAFDRCATDPACGRAFPNVRSEFDALLGTLRRGPAQLTLADPITGVRKDVTFTFEMLATGVRLLSYAPETVALLPLLIHDAHSTGDLRLLAAQSMMVSEQLQESISEAMNFSVVCTEDAPFYTAEEAARASASSYLGNSIAEALSRVCAVWPRGQIAPDFNTPVSSSVPVLLLSGEGDPVTPPSNGDFAARTLPNSLHLVVPGQGHNVVFRGCIPRIAASFVEEGSVAGLETSCVQEIQPAPFFTTFAGPEP